jgi:hypothetical protein
VKRLVDDFAQVLNSLTEDLAALHPQETRAACRRGAAVGRGSRLVLRQARRGAALGAARPGSAALARNNIIEPTFEVGRRFRPWGQPS